MCQSSLYYLQRAVPATSCKAQQDCRASKRLLQLCACSLCPPISQHPYTCSAMHIYVADTHLVTSPPPPQCGNVKDLIILKDKVTGAPRGCAFVSYGTKEEAENAIARLDRQVHLPGALSPLEVRLHRRTLAIIMWCLRVGVCSTWKGCLYLLLGACVAIHACAWSGAMKSHVCLAPLHNTLVTTRSEPAICRKAATTGPLTITCSHSYVCCPPHPPSVSLASLHLYIQAGAGPTDNRQLLTCN